MNLTGSQLWGLSWKITKQLKLVGARSGRRLHGSITHTSTETAGDNQVADCLHQCAGACTVAHIFTGALKGTLFRIVNTLFNQVLRNARRGFLKPFFTAGNQRTGQPLANTTTFQNAAQSDKWDNFQGAGDQAQLCRKVPFF